MARMVATKAALSIRVDALTETEDKSEPAAASIGIENRAKLESRLRALEHTGELRGAKRFNDGGKKQQRFEMKGETKTYNTAADAVELVSTQREDPMQVALMAQAEVKEEKRKAKEEKKARKKAKEERKAAEDDEEDTDGDVLMDADEEKEKKKKEKKEKKRKRESDANAMAVDDDENEVVRICFSMLHVFFR
jgi:nucleolar protein 58